MTKNNPNLNFYNPLRFLGAVIIACIVHLPFMPLENPSTFFVFIQRNGVFFVEMFFVISGSLFYTSFKRLINEEITIGEFFKRKVVRLFSLVILTSLYMLILTIARLNTMGGNPIRSLDIYNIIGSFLLGGFGVISPGSGLNGGLWYIFVLLLCFFLGVLLTLFSKHHNNSKIFFLLPILIGIGMYAMYKKNIEWIIWSHEIPRGLITFFLGFYLGVLYEKFDSFDQKKMLLTRIISFVVLACFVTLMCLPEVRNRSVGRDIALSFGIVFFPSLFVLLYRIDVLNKFFGYKFFKYLAELSFPIYAFNEPILMTLRTLDTDFLFSKGLGPWFLLFVLAISLAISCLYLFVEKLITKKLTSVKTV